MLVVKLGEALPVAEGFADDEHGSEREVIIMHDAGEILQLAAVDLLVGPSEAVASGDGSKRN